MLAIESIAFHHASDIAFTLAGAECRSSVTRYALAILRRWRAFRRKPAPPPNWLAVSGQRRPATLADIGPFSHE